MDMHINHKGPESLSVRLICFEISGHQICKCISCVNAPDQQTALLRLAPLFRDCELTPIEPESGYHT